MATLRQWIDGARPRTLPTALSPVLIGTGLAAFDGEAVPLRAFAALIVALGLQIGVNYANDYSDGIKGTDAVRVGPVRLVGQGLASPAAVRAAAWGAMAIAMACGLVLIAVTGQWWLILIGLACVVAAWLYTGGPKPYGYLGLGEVFVFIFFGIVPVLGTYFVQTGTVTASVIIASVAVGALACAVLVTNNLRDIPTDSVSGKNTLAVRIGDQRTRVLYVALIALAALATFALAAVATWLLLLCLPVFALAIKPIRAVRAGALGRDLIGVLKQTGSLVLAYGLSVTALLIIGLVLGSG